MVTRIVFPFQPGQKKIIQFAQAQDRCVRILYLQSYVGFPGPGSEISGDFGVGTGLERGREGPQQGTVP